MNLSLFVNSLGEKEIEKLQSLNIPGVVRIIELVKNNPQTFNEKEIKNEENGKEKDNPVYGRIQQELGRLSGYYLKNGDDASKIFTLDLIRKLETVPDEVYDFEAEILREPYNNQLHKELLISLFSRAERLGDKKSIELILENYDEADEKIKEEIKKDDFKIIDFLVRGGRLDSTTIEKTSKIVGIDNEELKETLDFLKELKSVDCYLDPRAENDIKDYRDLYARGKELSQLKREEENESISLLKEIREKFGAIPAMGIQDALLLLNDPSLKEHAFNKETTDFVSKYTNGAHTVKRLIEFANISNDTRFLIQEFNKDFEFRVQAAQDGKIRGNYAVLSNLLNDEKLKEETVKGERGEYEARISQNIGIEFLNYGNIAHDLLEKIKENEWITIQTYNRLYAARRSYTGFESYAYLPRKGEKHPVINVSFYGNMFGELDKRKSLLEGWGDKDENGFLPNGTVGGKEAIKIYAPNFEMYQKKLKEYSALESQEAKENFLENFSWDENPLKSSIDPEYEKIANASLPIGAAPNGHTRFYATPYGIVSGCVSQEGIFEAESLNMGVSLVTGHKEMLRDFFEKENNKRELIKEIKKPKAGGFEIEFENIDIPQELKEAALPANISVGEFLLNLHFEQYLHPKLTPRQDFLKELMQKFDSGELAIMAGDVALKLDDKILPHSQITLAGQEEEFFAKAA